MVSDLSINPEDAHHDLACLLPLLGCQARSLCFDIELSNQFAAALLTINQAGPISDSGKGQHLSRGRFDGPVVIDKWVRHVEITVPRRIAIPSGFKRHSWARFTDHLHCTLNTSRTFERFDVGICLTG